jgi:hypothetical protein
VITFFHYFVPSLCVISGHSDDLFITLFIESDKVVFLDSERSVKVIGVIYKRIASECAPTELNGSAKDESYLVTHNLHSDRRGSAILLFVTMLQY